MIESNSVEISKDECAAKVPFYSSFVKTVKVMLWNNKDGMVPICEAVLDEEL